jgi:hypothetical protein
MRNRVLSVLTLLLVAGATVMLQAFGAEPVKLQETAFHVELVIFRPLTPLGIREDWSLEASNGHASPGIASDEETGDDSTPNGSGRLAVASLSPALFRLSGLESGLQRSRGYAVIGHIGWTQIAVPRGSGLAVNLSEVGLSGSPVRGTGTLERGKYLYLRLNLGFTPVDVPASLVGDVQSTGPVTFSLNQVRRVRPFERHYFDHPAYGVIALITPVT